jgi:hypothetical protein
LITWKRVLLLTLVVGIGTGVLAVFFFLRETPELRAARAAWVEDFEYLVTILEENYPYFEVLKRKHGFDWLAEREKYVGMVRRIKNDEEFAEALSQILGELRQGHTGLVDASDYQLMLYSYLSLLDTHNFAPWLAVMLKDRVVERYKDMEGSKTGAEAKREVLTRAVVTQVACDTGIGYIRIPDFLPIDIAEDGQRIREFLESIRDFDYLIIDIRGNSGGADVLWREHLLPCLLDEPLFLTNYNLVRGGDLGRYFINRTMRISAYLPEGRNYPPELKEHFPLFFEHRVIIPGKGEGSFNGSIYLLVDEAVYSTAETFVAYMRAGGIATIVGTRTRGDGLGMESALVALPNSGLLVRFPVSMGLNPDGTASEEYGTLPDVVVRGGEDALEIVLAMIGGK